jgi:hypothetical protein
MNVPRPTGRFDGFDVTGAMQYLFWPQKLHACNRARRFEHRNGRGPYLINHATVGRLGIDSVFRMEQPTDVCIPVASSRYGISSEKIRCKLHVEIRNLHTNRPRAGRQIELRFHSGYASLESTQCQYRSNWHFSNTCR